MTETPLWRQAFDAAEKRVTPHAEQLVRTGIAHDRDTGGNRDVARRMAAERIGRNKPGMAQAHMIGVSRPGEHTEHDADDHICHGSENHCL